MISLLQMAIVVVPGVLRVGPLRLPVYGVFAAAGLIAAIWLSQRTARLARLDADKVWDAGMFAVLAAFVASRFLLVVFDLKAFLRYPLLVMALPSLTYGGMALTAVLVVGYLRWKKLAVLRVMDAWAPCAALLAAVLSLGHWVEGTDAGMPTRLPWGVVTPGDSVLGAVHPVQLYAVVVALLVCWLLVAMLGGRGRDGSAFPQRALSFGAKVAEGGVAGVGMVVGGASAFLLDFLRQPVDVQGGWMDPGQWVALGAMVVGTGLLLVPGGRLESVGAEQGAEDTSAAKAGSLV